METNCAPAGVGAYGCIFPIPYLVGDAIAFPNEEFRLSTGLLITANTNIFHSTCRLRSHYILDCTFVTSIPIVCQKHRFDLILGANIRYKPRLKSFVFALDAAKSFRRLR